MIVIVINTFRSEYYERKVDKLKDSIHKHLDDGISYYVVIVKGGCSTNRCCVQEHKEVNVDIVENLSDHNGFVGFERNRQIFSDVIFTNAIYIYIHDTCVISPDFKRCMIALKQRELFQNESNPQWIFAHTFGLYNIGVCNFLFMVGRGLDFGGIQTIPKEQSILLEHGYSQVFGDKKVFALLEYSKYTLACMIVSVDSLENSATKMDSYGINFVEEDGVERSFSFIASLGIYKFITSQQSYVIPIWAHKTHRTIDEEHYLELRKIGEHFVPLIPYDGKES